MCGETSRTLSNTVSGLSAKLTVEAAPSGMNTEISRSRMWQSGRKQTCSSVAVTGRVIAAPMIEAMMFSWLIMAPFGGPVVPEV